MDTKLRLSAEIRYFAGGSPLDIMLNHGMSRSSVYDSILGTVDVASRSPSLFFNEDNAHFPSHEEQAVITDELKNMSKAGFDMVSLAVDRMLVWTIQPSAKDCAEINFGEQWFLCYRKDKCGTVLMAGCDHKIRIRWTGKQHPQAGVISDYLAFSTSELGHKIEIIECGNIFLTREYHHNDW